MQENEYYSNGNLRVEWIIEPEDNVIIRKEYYLGKVLKSTTKYEDGRVEGVYKEYGKNNGYSYVLGTSEATSSVLYGDEANDLTQIILDSLNNQYSNINN